MSVKVNLPKPGMGTEEGTVIGWLKSEGDQVTLGEPLAEIEYAKATQEVESPATGTLVKILVAQGETAPVNSAIALIDEHP